MLTERQKVVLKVVVDEYIRTAEAIGSKRVMEILRFQYSSATLRNEMAKLEEYGFLEKTHTSSGRIPSSYGYQYYVTNLMSPELDEELLEQLSSLFHSRQFANEEIIQRACRIVSELTSLTSVGFQAPCETVTLAHFDFIRLHGHQILAIMVTSDARTFQQTLEGVREHEYQELKSCCQLLNDNLIGVPLVDLQSRLQQLLPPLQSIIARYEFLIQAFLSAFLANTQPIYQEGMNKMLAQPEFSDIERIRSFLELMANSNFWLELAHHDQRLSIQIGQLPHLSVVSRSFSMGKQQGQLMVVGPLRMPYPKVVSLLEYVSSEIEKLYRREK